MVRPASARTLAAIAMEHEVFTFGVGEFQYCYAWDVQFLAVEQQRCSRLCTYHERDGTVRKGLMHYTLESAQVSFYAPAGVLRAGQSGQLTATNDKFYDVTISSLKPHGDHIVVRGHAQREFEQKPDR